MNVKICEGRTNSGTSCLRGPPFEYLNKTPITIGDLPLFHYKGLFLNFMKIWLITPLSIFGDLI